MSATLNGRDIGDLRVVDLRAELEKRGLDKSGTKPILVERLQKAIEKDDDVEENHSEKGEGEDRPNDSSCVETKMTIQESKPVEEEETKSTLEKEQKAESSPNVCKNECKSTDAGTVTDAKNEDDDEGAMEVDEVLAHADEDDEVVEEALLEDEDACDEADALKDGVADDSNDLIDESVGENADEVESAVDESDEKESRKEEKRAKRSDAPTSTPLAKSKPLEMDKTDAKIAAAQKSRDKKAKEASPKGGSKENGETADDDKDGATLVPSNIKARLSNDQNRNLWITNISQTTRATELKQALSEHGKVMGAKVVINARHPAACCYGYVRMETVADADNCMAKLNNTELNGNIIRIEKVRPDHLNPNAKVKPDVVHKEKPSTKTPVRAPTPTRVDATNVTTTTTTTNNNNNSSGSSSSNRKERKPVEAPKDTAGSKERSRTTEDGGKTTTTTTRDEKRARSRSRERKEAADRDTTKSTRGVSEGVPRLRKERDILTFDKMKTERDRERERERERLIRTQRREESERVLEIERRQRSETMRLEREREKLKHERERLERERAEFLELERQRQKREREKIELERIELERAKMRMQEEERRATKRPAAAAFHERAGQTERDFEERKRPVAERRYSEAPPPPRFDAANSLKSHESPALKKFSSTVPPGKEYKPRIQTSFEKRESYGSKRDYDERSHANSSSQRTSSGANATSSRYEGSSSYSREHDPRRTSSGMSSISSTSKYASDKGRYNERDRERSPHFSNRSLRDERDRRSDQDSSKSSDIRSSRVHRFSDSKSKADSSRYERNSTSGTSWSTPKSFSSNSTSSKQWSSSKESWRSDPTNVNERWNNTTPRSAPNLPLFSSSASLSMGPSCPPPPGINTYVNDRFDYKSSMNSKRSY